MGHKEIEERARLFGSAKLTSLEWRRICCMRGDFGSWSAVKDALLDGNLPRFQKQDILPGDEYNAGVTSGCPVTRYLLDEEGFDKTVLVNLYLSRNRAHRMIARLLRETGNQNVLRVWVGNEPRTPEEVKVDHTIVGTPDWVIEQNVHVGAAKNENFSLCQFFRRLIDAEQEVVGPVELPLGRKLYLPIDAYREDACYAEDLDDLSTRIILRTLPHIFDNDVTKEQTIGLLLECFLSEPLLLEDNVWTRAQHSVERIARGLKESFDERVRSIGTAFAEGIPFKISDLRNRQAT